MFWNLISHSLSVYAVPVETGLVSAPGTDGLNQAIIRWMLTASQYDHVRSQGTETAKMDNPGKPVVKAAGNRHVFPDLGKYLLPFEKIVLSIKSTLNKVLFMRDYTGACKVKKTFL